MMVHQCSDCPFFSSNSEYPETYCGAAKRSWGMGYYQGGPAPMWCPLRRGPVEVKMISNQPAPPPKPAPDDLDDGW